MSLMADGEIIDVINTYLDRGMGSSIEQVILRRAAYEIQEARKERDHLMTQLITIGEKPNARTRK